MKRIILLISVFALLSGCSMAPQKGAINNTNSNNTTLTPTTRSTTETPSAEPVAGIESMSSGKVVWGPGEIKDHKKPADPISLQSTFASLGGRWLLNDDKKLALTFDEGYENGYTPSILDTLKAKKVKAIFFVTYDFAKDNPQLIKRMIDEGHTVGNHSYHHYSMDELDTATAKEEISFLHRYIKDEYNYTMSYFRFPKGEFSEKSLGIANELGYTSVFWSFAYADWDAGSQLNPDEAFNRICNSTHPGEIMLLHAVSKTNADILERVIDNIRQQGYEFTTDI
ncbi:MAG: polysaccharide deacetylase family protein [Eubacterium sp.]|nr:polysaccharide deacetylase family protein [Eubacterium sp.]